MNRAGEEIERRFLVEDASFLGDSPGVRLVQGYLSHERERTVRLRLEILPDGRERAWLTVKGVSRLEAGALVRSEWEVQLPAAEIRAGLELCRPQVLEKTRHRVEHAGHRWDVDVFRGPLAGLVLAEIELARPAETFERPPWLGREISGDGRWSNAALAAAGRPD